MTGFDIFDRYDFVMYLTIGLIGVAALILGAPLWALVPIYASGCVLGFIRHFDEVMYGESRKVTPEATGPHAPDTPAGAVSGLDRNR
jgi:hypothetical protein